LLLGEGMNLEM